MKYAIPILVITVIVLSLNIPAGAKYDMVTSTADVTPAHPRLLFSQGDGYEALTGVADGAYEVNTTRARRHAVFVDRRFWVLLDEIQTPQPETAELRFHTYGSVTEATPGHWVFEQAQAALDVVTPNVEITGAIETPAGWIRPVTALSLKASTPSRERTLVTVLQPRAKLSPALGKIRLQQNKQQLMITVESVQVTLLREPDGWRIKKVHLAVK